MDDDGTDDVDYDELDSDDNTPKKPWHIEKIHEYRANKFGLEVWKVFFHLIFQLVVLVQHCLYYIVIS